jgi:probable rRNA maturation factor
VGARKSVPEKADPVVSVDVQAGWNEEIDSAALLRAVVQTVRVAAEGAPVPVHPPVEVNVRVVDDAEMQSLNRTFRGVDRPTDVLSFSPYQDDDSPSVVASPVETPPGWTQPLGDIAVSYPTAHRQAMELDHSLTMEMAWLVVHGTLQLLGYSHETEDRAQHMEAMETKILRAMGFRKP